MPEPVRKEQLETLATALRLIASKASRMARQYSGARRSHVTAIERIGTLPPHRKRVRHAKTNTVGLGLAWPSSKLSFVLLSFRSDATG